VLARFSGRGLAPSNDEVGQPEERVELVPVFGQSPIAHFPMPENILEDVEGMRHERPDGM
jgi:hypothetical protein